MTMGFLELDSFVKKFVSLWRSGCEANLQVQSRAGNAYVNLQLGLGQADVHVHPPAAGDGGRRGGGPARQRRRTRREAERQSRSDAVQADRVFIDNREDKTKVYCVQLGKTLALISVKGNKIRSHKIFNQNMLVKQNFG